MKRSKSNSIITVDIYDNSSYKLINGKFTVLSKLKRVNKDVVISYVANRDLIIELIELSSHLPQDSINDIIEDKVYEELRLDPAIEYGIYPVKTALHSDESKYQVIIADKNSLKETFAPIAKKIKYIDYIIPAPLLYKVIYQNRKLSTNGTDMFIYFGEYDSFITFYHKGEFLYSKSIKFSLKQMYDRFCQLAQEVPLSKDEFRDLLQNGVLKNEETPYRDLFITIINECFLNINDILIYTKRAYEIDKIRNAFVGFSWGYMTGIESYVTNYLNLEGKAISSIYSKDDPKVAIDPIDALMAMTCVELEDGTLTLPNLTPYSKPLPITKRPAGKMISLFFVTILLGLSPSIYDYAVGATIQAKNAILSDKEATLTKIANEYKAKLKKEREELKALNSAIDKTSKLYLNKKGELTNVYNKKFKYQLRSEQLALITDVLKKYSIKSRFIKIDDTEYNIEVESKDDKEITAFIKDLVKHFDKTISSVDIKDIVYTPKEQLYKGVLRVEFMKELR